MKIPSHFTGKPLEKDSEETPKVCTIFTQCNLKPSRKAQEKAGKFSASSGQNHGNGVKNGCKGEKCILHIKKRARKQKNFTGRFQKKGKKGVKMQKASFWVEESQVQDTSPTDDVNIFCFTGFRLIFEGELRHPQAFESELALELE